MGLELRQSLKLTQQLVMTPQLQQAIKLLQLSKMELQDVVQQELLENPMLEVREEDPASEPKEKADANDRQELNADESDLMRSADWDDYLGDFSSTAKQQQFKEKESLEEMMSYEGRLSSKPTLHGHLLWQLCLSDISEEGLKVGEEILGNLSSSGYLQESPEFIAEETGADLETVLQVIDVIKHLDPVGVGSRDLRECLLIQLEIIGDKDPILFTLINEHLEDIEKKRYKPLARKFKINLEDLKAYLDIIQRMDPMPGSSFGGETARYVSPDAFVYKYDGKFVIVLSDDGLPKLQLNPYLMENMVVKKGKEGEYVQEKMRAAQWLIKSLHQRQRTLYKVVQSIVNFQKDFFESGVTSLKPLILKDVAVDIDMHESTVSRITTSKYLATPHGIFELKFFFNSALEVDDGTQVGSESVKATIKQLISEENPKKPFSDEKIAAILKDRLEINVARRTIAKYRAALGIESSSKRKQIL